MGNNTPVITVPGRTFPVSSMWLEDVVELTGYRLDPTMDSPYVSRGARSTSSSPFSFFVGLTAKYELFRWSQSQSKSIEQSFGW
jgi:HrpA-like RNA helicase